MWSDTLLALERAHLFRLALWGGGSVLAGTLLLALLALRARRGAGGSPLVHHFAIQTAAWGAIDLGLVAFAGRGLALRDQTGAAELERFLWLNLGLDVGYVGVGVTLAVAAWSLGRRRAAHAAPEGDLEAAERALVRPDAQQPPRLDDAVEAGPEMPERVVHEAADRRHPGDRIGHALEHGRDVRLELGVGGGLGEVAEVEGDLGHGRDGWGGDGNGGDGDGGGGYGVGDDCGDGARGSTERCVAEGAPFRGTRLRSTRLRRLRSPRPRPRLTR